MVNSYQNRGFSLLELLAAISLGSVILLGLGKLLTTTQRFKARADIESSVQEFDTLLAAELAALIRAYDSQPLYIPPIIQDTGVIRFVSGKPNRVHRSQERIRPDPDAQAISVLIPSFESRLRVRIPSSDPGHLHGCAPDGHRVPLAKFRTLLAIGIDGISEARIESIKENNGGCAVFRVRGSESAFFPALSNEEIPFVKLILPVQLEYTLYLGRGGELRYLGQAGEENIENQPIAAHIESFLPSILKTPDEQLLGMRLRATLHGTEIARSALSRFSKHQYAELLLNEI